MLSLDKTVIFFLLLYRPARQIARTGLSHTLLGGWGPLYHPAPRIVSTGLSKTLLEGWVPLYQPAPRTVSTALPHNPHRGMGSFEPRGPFYLQLQGLIFHKKPFIDGWAHLYCTDSVGLVSSCNKLASDRRAPLEVPAEGTMTKHPPQTQVL